MTSESIVPELRWVDPRILRPNPWNPNAMDPEMYARARESIRHFGFVDPVTVRLNTGVYEILDGEHRWKVAVEEGLTRIPIMDLGPVDDTTAKQLTIVLNELRGQAEPIKLGLLLRDLLAVEPKEQLLARLPYSGEALDRLTGLPSLQWEGLSASPRPQMPIERPSSWVERTYRMPIDAAEIIDAAINRWREGEDAHATSAAPDWRALELICADFLGS